MHEKWNFPKAISLGFFKGTHTEQDGYPLCRNARSARNEGFTTNIHCQGLEVFKYQWT